MAYNLSAFAGAGAQFFDANGTPLVGGKLFVYTAGTTTPATTWTTNSGAVANTNPIILDAAGRTPDEIWLNSGVTYKFVLKDANDVLIGTYDNIPAIDDPTVFNNLITVTGTNTLIGTSVPPYTAYVAGMTLSFIPVANNTGAVTIDVDGLGAKNIYSGPSTALTGGELAVGKIANVEYDGTRFQLFGATGIANGSITPAKLSTGGPSWDTSGNLTATGSVKATATGFIFPDSTTQATASPASVDVQTFASTATWTKPSGGYRMARIQVWGAGGGGGRSASAGTAYGGGGGAYNEITVPLSYLAASLTVTVGGGGAGATVAGSGSAGGTSSVPLATSVNGRSSIQAFGGGGGGDGFGGGGGGQLSAGGLVTPGSPSVGQVWGGGSGGLPGGTPVLFGGGGGSSSGAAGVSVWGGAGGFNAVGNVPGGGGGASPNANTNGFAGGAGQVIITCW